MIYSEYSSKKAKSASRTGQLFKAAKFRSSCSSVCAVRHTQKPPKHTSFFRAMAAFFSSVFSTSLSTMFRRFVLENAKKHTNNVSVRKRRHKTETRKLWCGNSAKDEPFLLRRIERHYTAEIHCLRALKLLGLVDYRRGRVLVTRELKKNIQTQNEMRFA